MRISSFLVFTLLHFFLIGCGQHEQNTISQDSIIKKWESATINIEARVTYAEEPKFIFPLMEKLNKKEITKEEFDKSMDTLKRSKYFGSRAAAIYVKYRGRHYFITARHVVENPISEGQICPRLYFIENGNTFSKDFEPMDILILPLCDTNLSPTCWYIFSSKDSDSDYCNRCL